MKTFPLLSHGVGAVTLLALLTAAYAQNIPTSSSGITYTNPPPPPPPPPISASTSRVATPTRGATVTRGATTGTATRIASARGPLAASTTWTTEKSMNDAFVVQFNNTGNFGGGRMPAPTMRIDPGMRLILAEQEKIDGPAKTITATYRIYSMELIGVAMHDLPVAFVVVRHKDNTASLNNRGLTDFEESALKQLQSGKQIVNELVKTDRLVVGAVRAEQSCIPCHEGAKVGDLLGAFTYHLTLVDAPASPTTKQTADASATPELLALLSHTAAAK